MEKPVCATSEQVHDLITIAKEKNVVFAPYHNRRFDGDFRTVRKLINDGKDVQIATYANATHDELDGSVWAKLYTPWEFGQIFARNQHETCRGIVEVRAWLLLDLHAD